MNRTLLLIICDFLLLSMLSLARFEEPDPVATQDSPITEERSRDDLVELLELSLREESESRETLSENLSETRQALEDRERLLREREEALETARREAEAIARAREEEAAARQRSEEEAARLAEERRRLEAERDQTRQRLEATETERTELVRSLGETRESATLARERLRQTEEAMARQAAELARRTEELERTAAERETLAQARAAAERDLEVTRAERSILLENLEMERRERDLLRTDRERAVAQTERLTEGVSALAESSENIRQEIERSRPLTTSAIFSRFESNQGAVRLSVRTRGFFGESQRVEELPTTLVSDGSRSFLVFHSTGTPLHTGSNTDRILSLNIEARLGEERFDVSEIAFLATDPRVLLIEVPGSIVRRVEKKPFLLSLEPDRFDEAVIIKRDASNFGRTSFRRLTISERFLRMDRPAFGEMFADFATSRGDLVFSKNGEFIGVMANQRHATVLEGFVAAGRIPVGNAFDNESTAQVMERLRARVRQLPTEAQ